ncbi:MAG TPA: hypothetical protein VM165_01470 [Planctomycetaceae bacterium]|nr:hypothetical protein [Planctomycetaceae bacterium]
MTVSPLVWLPLALGLAGLLWPGSWRRPTVWIVAWFGLCVAAVMMGAAIGCVETTSIVLGLDNFARRALPVVGLWAGAFGWVLLRDDQHSRSAAVGRGGVILGGLTLSATSTDLIGLSFAIEMVCFGTSVPRREVRGMLDRLPFLGLCVGAAGCLGVTGSLELVTMRDVLAGVYTPAEPLLPIGRPALVLVGSVALWMIAAAAPVGVRAVSAVLDERGEPLEHQLAALTARQLVALLALSRWIAVGLPGLEATVTTLLVMLSLIAGGCAVWLLNDRQRLDRLVGGFALWQSAGQLLWLTAAIHDTGNIVWLPAGWSHDLLVLAAMVAIAVSWVGRSSPVAYLDELRGLGAIRPVSAALLLVPLASLLGGPLVAGGWLRLTMMAQLFALHVPGPDDLLFPRLDVRYALLLWSVVWIVSARAAVEIGRVVLLETPLRIDAQPRGRWATAAAALAATALIAAGCCPYLLTLLTTP